MPINLFESKEFILLGIALVIAAFLLRRVARSIRAMATSGKGSLSLELHNGDVTSGVCLSGCVSISIKRPLRGALTVSLVGQESRKHTESSRSRLVDVYREDHVLEETRDFPAGHSQSYEFKITAPTASEVRRGEAILRKLSEGMTDQTGAMMKWALKAASASSQRLQQRVLWSIESRLDTSGIDLVSKRRVQIKLYD